MDVSPSSLDSILLNSDQSDTCSLLTIPLSTTAKQKYMRGHSLVSPPKYTTHHPATTCQPLIEPDFQGYNNNNNNNNTLFSPPYSFSVGCRPLNSYSVLLLEKKLPLNLEPRIA